METTIVHTQSDALRMGYELLGGRYRIIKALGRGGFGITYLAEHALLNRRVCIKEFFPKAYYKRDGDTSHLTLSSDGFRELMSRFKSKFIKEAHTIATLDHPNIIHIYDVFEENDTAYYVMEYIEGESLHDIVSNGGAMAETEAKKHIRQLADALDYIHSRDIIHLDVKPSNVMVNRADGRIILIDFGLSKHYDSSGAQTSTTPIGISHGYAPIEQYQEGGVNTFSPCTDIYSLGATLYYLVVGKTPLAAAIVGEDGLGELPSHLSRGVCRAIEQSMQYRRKDRPANIRVFVDILDDVSANTPHANKQEMPPYQQGVNKRGDNRWLVWLVLLLFIMIGAGGVFLFLYLDADTKASDARSATNNRVVSENDIVESEQYVDYEEIDVVDGAICYDAELTEPVKPVVGDYTETAFDLNMDFVWVDGGRFMMGSDNGEKDEKPIHIVSLDGYWMAATEVTQSQWEAVMNTTIDEQRQKANYNQLHGVGSNYPIYFVSYHEALEFCRRLSSATGKRYTLPTEAQWEYAAKGGHKAGGYSYTYSGSDYIDGIAWCKENSNFSTHPVGLKTPNQLGIYDMSGNVYEWCLDWLGSYSGVDEYNPQGPKYGEKRVLRGGGWCYSGVYARVANRGSDAPDDRFSYDGFRVVCLQ